MKICFLPHGTFSQILSKLIITYVPCLTLEVLSHGLRTCGLCNVIIGETSSSSEINPLTDVGTLLNYPCLN